MPDTPLLCSDCAWWKRDHPFKASYVAITHHSNLADLGLCVCPAVPLAVEHREELACPWFKPASKPEGASS